jgi:hypothetical protein
MHQDTQKTYNEVRREELNKALDSQASLATIKDYYMINYEDKFIEPEPILSLNKMPFGYLGEFSMVIGKPKARKSFLVALLASSNYTENEIIKMKLPDHKSKIVIFDTEQSQFELQRSAQRIKKLITPRNPDNICLYNLRELNHNLKKKFIEDIIEGCSNIGFVIIDGIRDLITDINSIEQATNIVEWLLALSSKNNIHIVNILHQNKGDGNARGHLGTELTNKASGTISISLGKNKEISVVMPEYLRNKDFEPFTLKIDSDGLPYVEIDGNTIESKKRKPQPNDYSMEVHREILKRIFEDKETLSYSQLWKGIQNDLQTNGIEIGTNAAKDFLKYFKEENLIKNENSSWTINLV